MIVILNSFFNNRRFGRTYPSINTKPPTKYKKAAEKLRLYVLAKGVRVFNALRRRKMCDSAIDHEIQLKGMLNVEDIYCRLVFYILCFYRNSKNKIK